MGLTKQQAVTLGIAHLFPKTAKRRPSHVPGVMNRTELRYAEGLEARRLAGEIRQWSFESLVLTLGPEMTFRPDFVVEYHDGATEIVDVKGRFVREDSVIKMKAAAVLYPQYRFLQAKWKKQRWTVRVFRSGKEGIRP